MKLLTVVSSAAWVAEDFASTGNPVKHSLGFDLPDQHSALWCTGSFMNRIIASGVTPNAVSAGTRLLEGQHDLLDRRVLSFKAFMMDDAQWPGKVFVKPAEAKLASLPAAVYASFDDFRAALSSYGVARNWDDRSVGQLTFQVSEIASWEAEYRCFVAHDQVVASSFYLDAAGTTWDAYEPDSAPSSQVAAAWAQTAVDELAQAHAKAGLKLPAGFVLDVGVSDGKFSVIEANASWSSNPYHCDIHGVLASVMASQEKFDPVWQWTPDAPLVQYTRALRR